MPSGPNLIMNPLESRDIIPDSHFYPKVQPVEDIQLVQQKYIYIFCINEKWGQILR